MTGAEIIWWLEGIWDDLLDLGSADVPLLVFKLVVLVVVAFFGWQLGRMVVRGSGASWGRSCSCCGGSCRRRCGSRGGA